jgi:hypothetical protein
MICFASYHFAVALVEAEPPRISPMARMEADGE